MIPPHSIIITQINHPYCNNWISVWQAMIIISRTFQDGYWDISRVTHIVWDDSP